MASMGLAGFALVGCAPGGPGEGKGGGAGTGAGGNFIETEKPVEGEYIVVLDESEVEGRSVASAAEALRAEFAADFEILRTFETVLTGFAAEMEEPDARALADEPAVRYVEENGVIETQTEGPGAAWHIAQGPSWGLDRIDQRGLPLDGTFESSARGGGVDVYILDSGLRTTHTEFGGRAREAFTAVDDGNGPADCHGHGTHVAGTVGGRISGVAPHVDLHSVRVLDCNNLGNTINFVSGVEWVAENASGPSVANMSLGTSPSESLDEAIAKSTEAGITYVVSAGNADYDACEQSPARSDVAITVGATDREDARAEFSNYGPCVDIFAPGVDIGSAWATGDRVAVLLGGTSMAAPHVAGVAALYLGENPEADPEEVREALLEHATATEISDAGEDSPELLLYSGFVGADREAVARPELEIANPEPGATVSGSVDVEVEVESAADELEELWLEIPGQGAAELDGASGARTWNTENARDGYYALTATARRADGDDTHASIWVRVENEGEFLGWRASAEPDLEIEAGEEVCSTIEVEAEGAASPVTVEMEGRHDDPNTLSAYLQRGDDGSAVFWPDNFAADEEEFAIHGRAVYGFEGGAAGAWTLCLWQTQGSEGEGVLESFTLGGERPDAERRLVPTRD